MFKLFQSQFVIVKFDQSSLIFVFITIIRRGKYCDNLRYFTICVAPLVQFKSIKLNFMCSYDANKFINLHKFFHCLPSIKIRTSSNIVRLIIFLLISLLVLNWIRPNQITKHSRFWNFSKSLNFVYITYTF